MGRSDLTKQKILDAALIEFGEKGFEPASTNTITLTAGVSKGSVFKYYPTKAELFYAIYTREFAAMMTFLEPFLKQENADPFEKVMDITLSKVRYAREHPHATRLMMDAITKPPQAIRDRLMSHLAALTKLSVNILFDDLPMDQIDKQYSKSDVLRNLEIALSGLQAIYITPHTNVEQLETIKQQSIAYLKVVLRGMEAAHECD